MRKLGPLLAIISGLVLTIFATLSMLIAMGKINEISWLFNFEDAITANKGNNTATAIYGMLIGIGLTEVTLGRWAWRNPRGIAALTLFGLVAASIIFTIINGQQSHSFPSGTIGLIVVQSIAALGMLSGFMNGS